MKMSGNTIFITGGGSGIGRGLAEAFHKLGNQVIISGRRKANLDETIGANPGMAAYEMDITDPASIEQVAAKIIADYPALNVLFNNAGIMPFDDAAKAIDGKMMQIIVTTNFLGPIRMTSALIEHLKKQPSAVIINNTSVLAYVPLAYNAVYSATKAALHSFTMSQRFTLRDTSVKVHEIAPPWVDTDLVKKSGDPRAMPLDVFVKETMEKLATDREDIYVDAIQMLRDNPGSNEHEFFFQFNEVMVKEPIPV
ncbi:short-chain dehydrogenase [Rhizobium sp. Leaf306]|uniref:SDR family oxidoreductase n=1 Tax=Rhizobium sp. Leaf306 TaxID=1736330 RepID=UPI0007140F1B|nr:SDR family NAD(P)-dependent oxidoreductase [Rhizobium sp. Leaf306]KQQ38874.1 short-chain dehydrogenase [Rhizobium sp. Leaf306]